MKPPELSRPKTESSQRQKNPRLVRAAHYAAKNIKQHKGNASKLVGPPDQQKSYPKYSSTNRAAGKHSSKEQVIF